MHVRYAGGYAKFWLVPICLAHPDNMKVQELAKAEEMIAANEGKIRRRWNEVFGARG